MTRKKMKTGKILLPTVVMVLSTLLCPLSYGIDKDSPRLTPVVSALANVMPSVVNIGTERVVRVSDPFEDWFNQFFTDRARYYKKAIPLGSGIIIDPSGLVVTNYHVIRRASKITIRLWNGESYEAHYIAGDAANDLALMQIMHDFTEAPLQAIRFAVPDDLLLGETVVAVGNPFGLEHSVASGVLSAKNRKLEEQGVEFNDIIQTDAAINPGNSGGPMVNLDGDLIGINLAIRRGAEGIGFAIPLRRIEEILSSWLKPERFSAYTCGLTPVTEVTDSGEIIAKVCSITKGGPAAEAGLECGMQITEVNGIPVMRAIDISRLLWRMRADKRKSITIKTSEKTFHFNLRRMSGGELTYQRLGIRLQSLTASLKRALQYPDELSGMIISDLETPGFLDKYNISRGDVLASIENIPVNSEEDLTEILESRKSGDAVTLNMYVIQEYGRRRYLQPVQVKVILK